MMNSLYVIATLIAPLCHGIELSEITKELLGLFIGQCNDDKRAEYVLSVSNQASERKLLLQTVNKDVVLIPRSIPHTRYQGHKVYLVGEDDGFYWTGGTLKDTIETDNNVCYDPATWVIVQHEDNTLNRFMTNKHLIQGDDISDIMSVFEAHGLLKDDSKWVENHVFLSSDIIEKWASFTDNQIVRQFIRDNFRKTTTPITKRIPIIVTVVVDTDGNMVYKSIDVFTASEYSFLLQEGERIARMICDSFKMQPAVHRGVTVKSEAAIIFYASDITAAH